MRLSQAQSFVMTFINDLQVSPTSGFKGSFMAYAPTMLCARATSTQVAPCPSFSRMYSVTSLRRKRAQDLCKFMSQKRQELTEFRNRKTGYAQEMLLGACANLETGTASSAMSARLPTNTRTWLGCGPTAARGVEGSQHFTPWPARLSASRALRIQAVFLCPPASPSSPSNPSPVRYQTSHAANNHTTGSLGVHCVCFAGPNRSDSTSSGNYDLLLPLL